MVMIIINLDIQPPAEKVFGLSKYIGSLGS